MTTERRIPASATDGARNRSDPRRPVHAAHRAPVQAPAGRAHAPGSRRGREPAPAGVCKCLGNACGDAGAGVARRDGLSPRTTLLASRRPSSANAFASYKGHPSRPAPTPRPALFNAGRGARAVVSRQGGETASEAASVAVDVTRAGNRIPKSASAWFDSRTGSARETLLGTTVRPRSNRQHGVDSVLVCQAYATCTRR